MGKKESPRKGSSSPKKGSPGKKGSPSKSNEPPIDNSTQTDFVYYCMRCGKSFDTGAGIQAHVILFDHGLPFSPYEQKCRACHEIVEVQYVDLHKCARDKKHFLELILSGTGIKYGPPNICLFCRGAKMMSRSNLISHLFARHRYGRLPGVCGDCCYQFEEVPNAPVITAFAKEPEEPQPEYILPDYPTEMEKHYHDNHDVNNALIIKKKTQAESYIRFPYVCPYCLHELKNNAQFQSHILCVHGTNERYEPYLSVCKGCGKPTESDTFLNHHSTTIHCLELTNLAKECVRQNLVQNSVPLAQTCTLCWMYFKYDFYLQAHIQVTHLTTFPFECGLCKRDFSLCGTMSEIWQIMRKHEKNHYREFHLAALERNLTFEKVPDEIPEVADKVVTEEDVNQKASPGKKGSPKDKKGKDSPKSKGSPKKGK